MSSSISAQRDAATATALVVPAQDRAAIVAAGPDATTWLNGLLTCDLRGVGDRATYGLLVEKKGRIQSDVIVARAVRTELLALALAVPAPLRDAVLATLDHYLIMENVELTTPSLRLFHAHGPRAAELAARVPSATFVGTLDLLGSGGAFLAGPADGAVQEEVAAAAAAVGGVIGDDDGWNAVRIARGVPRFGFDFDASCYPQEASLEGLAVAFDKGCYLGQEVVYMLQNRGHVQKRLVRLEVEGDDPIATGAAIMREGKSVGEVRSSVADPGGRGMTTIAMVKWAYAKAGESLDVSGRRAVVQAIPFAST